MYPVTVSSRNEYFTRKQKRRLKRFGLAWDGYEFHGLFDSEKKIVNIKYYCQQHRLNFKISNAMGNRSTNYRSVFFSHNEPKMFGKYYICSYCGKLLSQKNTTVDHLYPIGKSSKSIKYQKKLKKKGIYNINSVNNLVAACARCNKRKSDNAGFWIFKGRIGQYKWLWFIRWILKFLIFVGILYLLIFRRDIIVIFINDIVDFFRDCIRELSQFFIR